jgi:hypothetical protein
MMADSLSISSINTAASLARISSVALPLSTTNTVTSNSISLDSSSSIVTLSNSGQLLSALTSLQTQLANSLQSSVSTTNPANTSALAQSLVSTFNNLQGSTNALQGVLGSDATNNLFSSALANNASQLASLSSIGIELQPASNTLSINTDTFNAALASDPNASRSALESAAQALLDVSSGLELQLAGASLAQTNPALLGSLVDTTSSSTGSETTVPVELLQNLSADSVLTNIQLTDLNLPAAGQDINTILTDSQVLQGALSADLPISNNAVFPATADLAALAGSSAATIATTSLATAQPVTTTSVDSRLDTAIPLATASPTSTVTNTTTPAAVANVATPSNGDALAADLATATARTALQTMLSDPSLQVLRNILDPNYAALVAATRTNEMSPFMSIIDPKAFATDLPAQVVAVQPPRAISDYQGASVGS